jgi:hypothetical protein
MALTLKIRHNHELRDWAPVLKAITQSDRFFATQFDISHLNTIVAKLRQNKD